MLFLTHLTSLEYACLSVKSDYEIAIFKNILFLFFSGPPLQWGEFLMRFSALSGFLVRRADDTLMFFHPTFREWLYKRSQNEPQKFLCDPRTGHAAIALRMSRNEAPLNPDRTLDLGKVYK